MEEPGFEGLRNQRRASPIQNFFAFCPSQKTYTSATPLNMQSWEIAAEYQPSIVDDKRLRRMISNRESARRSRMRKKKQIEELQSQVDQLQTINRQFSQKLIDLLESNHEILQENAQLKEKVSTLHMVLTDVFTPLRNLEDTSLEHKSAS